MGDLARWICMREKFGGLWYVMVGMPWMRMVCGSRRLGSGPGNISSWANGWDDGEVARIVRISNLVLRSGVLKVWLWSIGFSLSFGPDEHMFPDHVLNTEMADVTMRSNMDGS